MPGTGSWPSSTSTYSSDFAASVVGFEAERGRGSGGDDDHGDGGGGRRRPPPAPSRPGGDPVWWPEFEREFAAYAERERVR